MVGATPSFPAAEQVKVPTRDDPAVEARRKKFLAGETAKSGRDKSLLTKSAFGAPGEPPLFSKTLSGA